MRRGEYRNPIADAAIFGVPKNNCEHIVYKFWERQKKVSSYDADRRRRRAFCFPFNINNFAKLHTLHITVGKGDNIMMKMSKKIQDFLFEDEKRSSRDKFIREYNLRALFDEKLEQLRSLLNTNFWGHPLLLVVACLIDTCC